MGVDQCLFRCEIETGYSVPNYALISHIGMGPETLNIVLYRLVVCVLLPYCHVQKQKMKYQWFRRIVRFDFL